jgi:site-specific DNA-cytosine methylase
VWLPVFAASPSCVSFSAACARSGLLGPRLHLWEEAYLTLHCTMVQRMRAAARVLLENLPKIHSEDFALFLVCQQALLVSV